MVPAFCEDARARRLGDGSLRHTASRVVGRPCGASASNPDRHHGVVGGSGGRGSRAGCSVAVAGRRRSVDLATVWLHYDGGIAAFDAGSTGRGTGCGWGVGGHIGAAERGRRAFPKAEKTLFGGRPPPVFFPVGSRDQTLEYFWLVALTPVRDHGIWAAYGPLGSL